jgi:hypothetical protein
VCVCAKVIGISKTDMEQKRELVSQWYANVVKISGISLLHSFTFYPSGVVEGGKCHGAEKSILFYPSELVEKIGQDNFNSKQPPSFHTGEWVAVLFEDDWYPGCIEKVFDSKLSIKFMKRKALNQ